MPDDSCPWENDIGAVLLTEDRIQQRVQELAAEVSADYAGQHLVLVVALKGAFVFAADLMRALQVPLCVDFVAASSYGKNTVSSGEVRVGYETCGDLEGRHVLVVEDIVDSGRTLSVLVASLRSRGAASVKTCCLLDKPSRRVVDFRPEYVGFEIPDHFVIGYGLDYAERYRSLPFVAVLKPEAYQ